jgi:hypothetical protein
MKALTQAQCDRMRRLCELHPQVVVARLMHIDPTTVCVIKKRGFKASTGGPARRPMPDDFRIQADVMTLHELARHYRTGLCCVRRWIEEAGGRRFTPRSSARLTGMPTMPPREVVAAAVENLGATRAAAEFGVSPTTLQKWRQHYGLPIRHKRVVQLRKRPALRGWAERYHEDRAAA